MRHNYLNNKDILKEIHKSKTTYCCFLDPADADYDMILLDVNKINKKNIIAGRKARAERLAKLTHEAAAIDGVKRKLDEFEIKLKDVNASDVIFRVMTWDHIPIDDVKSRKAAIKLLEEEGVPHSEYDDDAAVDISGSTKYVKCNFPPFYHYRVNDDEIPFVMGKSHVRGGVDNGTISKEQ